MNNKQNKKIENQYVGAFALGLSALLLLRDVGGVSLSKYIFVVYCVFFMVIASYEMLVHMVCFMFPLLCGLPSNYILTFALIMLVIRNQGLNNRQVLIIMFLLAMEIIAALWYPSTSAAVLNKYITFASLMMFLIHNERELNFVKCIQMYLFGSCLLCGTILTTGLMTAPINWLELLTWGSFRLGETQGLVLEGMILRLNPNLLAYYSVAGIACSIYLADQTTGKAKIGYIFTGLLTGAAGLMTLGRAWVLVTAICLLFYIFSKVRNAKTLAVAIISVMLFAGAVLVFSQLAPDLWEGYMFRFTDSSMESGSGRANLMEYYMGVFTEDPRIFFMGTGVTGYHALLSNYESFHNGIQQILVSYGIVGFCIFMAALIYPAYTAVKKSKKRLKASCWLPFLAVGLSIQSHQFLAPETLMFPYVICVYTLRAGGQSYEKLYCDGGHGGRQPLAVETRQGYNN